MTEKNIESNVSIPDEKKTTEGAVEANAITENVVSDESIVKETQPKTAGVKEIEEIRDPGPQHFSQTKRRLSPRM